MKYISAATSTIGLLQSFDEEKIKKFINCLEDDDEEIIIDQGTATLKKELTEMYPPIMKRIENIYKLHHGKIPPFVRKFYMALLIFCPDIS